MKSTYPALTLLTSALFLTSHAQLIPFLFKGEPSVPENIDAINSKPKPAHQRPMNPPSNDAPLAPGIQLPPSDNGDNDNGRSGEVILSDVINSQDAISIFAGITHAVSSISSRLENAGQNTTVLAPRNSAISPLPRKPWEDPREYAALGMSAYSGASGEDRAQRNMRRFAEAHVVPQSPWREGEKVETMAGEKVWWEQGKDGKVLMPGSVKVESVAKRVANGEVWVLEEVRNYAT